MDPVTKKKSSELKKPKDHMKVSPEDLYSWIEYCFEKLETNDGKDMIKNAWKGCGLYYK